MSDMASAKTAFPDRHADLIERYASLEMEKIVSLAPALRTAFDNAFSEMTQAERDLIRAHFSKYICDESGWALSNHNILFLYFLRDCFAGWCPNRKISAKRIAEMIRNISSYRNKFHGFSDIERRAVYTLCLIVQGAIAKYGNNACSDAGSDVDYLMKTYCINAGNDPEDCQNQPNNMGTVNEFIGLMKIDAQHLYASDVAEQIKSDISKSWTNIRGDLLAAWKECLSEGSGKHFESYLALMAPATGDPEFLEQMLSEFARRLEDPNGFRQESGLTWRLEKSSDFRRGVGAPPETWIKCLQMFPAWSDWGNAVQKRWPDIRGACFARWRHSLAASQVEQSFFNPVKFLDVFAPSRNDAEWLSWAVDEFFRRFGRPDSFRGGASPYVWVECLQKFPAWGDWDDAIQRHWPDIRVVCLARWRYSLKSSQVEHPLFNPVQFLDVFAPSKDDEEWLDWAVDEFVKRLGLPNGFQNEASPEVWVNCLQKFPAWNDWDDAVQRHWDKLRESCFARLKNTLAASRVEYSLFDPMKYINTFAPGKHDEEWLRWTVDEFVRRMAISDGFRGRISAYEWRNILQLFVCWRDGIARQILEGLGGPSELLSFDIIRQMLVSSSQVSSSSRVCIALVFLMWAHDEFAGMRDRPSEHKAKEFDAQKEEIGSLAHGTAVLWLFARLQDLPTRHYNHRSVWGDLGPDEKAAWRTEIAKYVGDQVDVRHGLIEFLLWQTTGERFRNEIYSEMELLVLGLCQKDVDIQFIKKLQTHPSRLVQVRSTALLARLGQISEPDPFLPLPDDGVTVSAAHQALSVVAGGEYSPSRTWMQDGAVERIIYDGVRRVESLFCEEYEREWRLEEEMHLSSLLSKVQGALAGVNGVLDALARQGIGIAPRIDFSFRQVPKHEEGASGIGSRSFATDVAFMIRVTDAGRLVTHRATLVQCKKLNANDAGAWRPSFDIKRDQCDDLIAQTDSSFYMFLSPAFVGREVWMTPARLVRNLSDLHGTKGTLPHAPTYYASRSFAHWLTYDLFGLWTGDEKSEVVEKAEGGKPGYSPRFVVSVVIHRNPTHDEAPNRPRSRK